MDIHTKIIAAAIRAAAAKHGVSPDDLSFIGVQDETFHGCGILLHFNVMDPGHPKYRSTVCLELFRGPEAAEVDRERSGKGAA